MTRVRLPPGVEPRFVATQLHYLWMTGFFKQICVNHVNQASVAASRLTRMATLLLPPSNEQKRIVAAIEEQFSRLDAADDYLRAARERLQRLRASALTEDFDGAWPTKALVDVTDPDRVICYGILMPKENVDNGRAILDRAFRGTLVPQDPNDEPASVLLERINAERVAEPPRRRTASRRYARTWRWLPNRASEGSGPGNCADGRRSVDRRCRRGRTAR